MAVTVADVALSSLGAFEVICGLGFNPCEPVLVLVAGARVWFGVGAGRLFVLTGRTGARVCAEEGAMAEDNGMKSDVSFVGRPTK